MSIIPDEEAWKRQGLCVGCKPEVFFPQGRGKKATEQAENAKRICEGCPVRPNCLQSALSRPDEMGIWGGTDEKERKIIRQQLGIK